ncbi:diguanylate cyclase [Thermodesulfobacteriota bacterium]
MRSIRNQLLDIFEQFSDDDAGLLEALQDLITKEGKGVYTFIFQILTNLDLPPAEAEKHWQRIISNCNDLSSAIGREVNLRTAVCDYFCSINKSLHNPKIIEIRLFEKATKSSTFDNLTGLLNRNTFDETLHREVSRAKRHDSSLTLLFIDLDDFKNVNDTFGHLAGDEVLKKVAHLIMVEKRSEDIAARYGGEEIALLLPETSKADGWLIGERIRKKVEEIQIPYEDQNIHITLSGGIASFPIDASDDLTLLKSADLAMYRAKSFGKNNISFFSLDKRRNIRVDYNIAVEIQELGMQVKPMLTATTKSLSIGGILLESQGPLEIGSKIQINITFDSTKPLLIIGTVIRSDKTESSNYETSIAFLDSDKVVRNEISSYLIKHLKELPPETSDTSQNQS